ncbi:MAG: acyltransferase domain-containing protein [Richelia sp. SM1_7_0]|nr:acyltransferase domain-containing protein [Richelia sp. SM1_7_0]
MEGIAIIGMAGRFPGASNVQSFWENLCNGVESLSILENEELLNAGVPLALINNTNYVKAANILENIDLFDAGFFDINPKEAELTDPQHRLFLECAWEALENAGYDSTKCESRIGVYAGASLNNYLDFDVKKDGLGSAESYQKLIGNDKDFLSTRVSYKLNLTGPSLTVQTACSTSLVATTLACQSLLNYQCDIALAGGVSIRVPQTTGYLYQQGGTLSADGHCRAFDINAGGTTIGNGVGLVVLKRLNDAIADGDCIYAVIKGTAINNDGSIKVGFSAPSVDGQAEAIAEAIVLADVEPETINYIEAHGTGTSLGDPIEIAALSKVFAASTEKKAFCAIGSVKTNIGHLDAAAGIAGLIKTSLALKHQLIPPSLNFEQPNPQIDFTNSPFFVNTKLREWEAGSTPRRAGVSSLGMGGTNAHVVLEQAPVLANSGASRAWQLLVLSAKTESALETATQNLIQYLKLHLDENLADIAYTLQLGRRDFNHRKVLICSDIPDAINGLTAQASTRVFTQFEPRENPSIAFMFPGQGSQYVNMGKELYATESVFRKHIEHCSSILIPYLGLDLRSLIYPSELERVSAAEKLKQTYFAQPALFVIEYALAQLWMSWGISPQATIGHSIGEYVAATLAGVFSLEDALVVVANRGKLMQQLPGGAMLSVELSEQEIAPLLAENISLAACNTTSYSTVSGCTEAIEKLQQHLQQIGVSCRRLHTSHAFHSQMMEPIVETFTQLLQKVKLNPPEIPFISNVSGTWITKSEATNANYWAKHLRQPVRFCQGIAELLKTQNFILLEVGLGRTLSTFAKQQQKQELIALTSLPHPKEQQSDVVFSLNTLGKLWLSGIKIDWSGFYINERRHRLPLPTYPFERQRYWLERDNSSTSNINGGESSDGNSPSHALGNQRYSIKLNSSETASEPLLEKKPNITDWFNIPVWKQLISVESFQAKEESQQKLTYLIFIDKYGVGTEFAQRLGQLGQDVITVGIGKQFCKLDDRVYTINPQESDDYHTLFEELKKQDLIPRKIAHFWSITPNDTLLDNELKLLEKSENLGFYSLMYLAQAIGKKDISDSLKLLIVTNNLYHVIGDEKLCPQKATVLGATKVIPKEYGNINCTSVDLVIHSARTTLSKKLIDNLVVELKLQQAHEIIAYRGHYRWIQTWEAVALDEGIADRNKLKKGGVYLITGGFGGIGLVLAEHLAKTLQAKLILVGREKLPQPFEWEQWLATHDTQDRVSRKIQKVRSLEELGAEVELKSADVTNFAQMQAVIALGLQRFGQINGVIHAAGIAGGGVTQLKTREMASNVLASKVTGTLILEEVCKNINLDFLMLCSSKTSILGEFGQIDYCAANSFLDAYAYCHNSTSDRLTISISWDTWKEVGLAVETTLPDNIKQQRQEMINKGILPQEGIDVFNRVLASNLPHIVVSTQDLPALIKQNNSDKYLQELTFSQSELSSVNVSKARHSRPNLGNNYVAPQNQTECILTEIWQEILGIENIGIYDNFFELGGNSINTIQIAANANKAGLKLTTQQFFQHQTIAELVKNLSITETIQPQQKLERKELQLTPSQHYFFEQNQPEVHKCNQSLLLEMQECEPNLLEQALEHLIQHHDVFRLHFIQTESGTQQVYDSSDDTIKLKRVDLSSLSEIEQKLAIESVAAELKASLNLFAAPLVRFAFFDLAPQPTSYLLIVIHDLVIDNISWQILLEDLQTVYKQKCQRKAIDLPDSTSSYIQWTQFLQQYVQSSEMMREQDYWLREIQKPFTSLPVDYAIDDNTHNHPDTVSVSLNKQTTKALLEEIHQAYNTQINDVLLTALVQAFAKWTGEAKLRVDIRNDGRKTVFQDIKLSRTVGLFSSYFPIILDATTSSNQEDLLIQIKEYLRSIPNNGVGYGILKYLNSEQEIQSKLQALPQSEISFNYLGQHDQMIFDSSLFRLTQSSQDIIYSRPNNRKYLLEINAIVVQEQLQLYWNYNNAIHNRETIENLANKFIEELSSLIAHCNSVEAQRYTPSDFFRAKLNQQQLDNLLSKINRHN